MKSRLQSFLMNGVRLAFDWRLGRGINDTWNRRAAMGTIKLCRELSIIPSMLVDVGANESEFARWIVKAFPEIKVVSFEPNLSTVPIGSVYRLGLSDVQETAPAINSNGAWMNVGLTRFDKIVIPINRPAILKIDAEQYSFRALKGFGERLNEFDIVMIEATNHTRKDCHLHEYGKTALVEIVCHMNGQGFCMSRVLDTGIYIADKIQHLDIAFWK